jgi:hypothetical protein
LEEYDIYSLAPIYLLEGQDRANGAHDHAQRANDNGRNVFGCLFAFLGLEKHNGGVDKDKGGAKGGTTDGRYQTQIGELARHDGNHAENRYGDLVEPAIVATILDAKHVQESVPAADKDERVRKGNGNRHGNARETGNNVLGAVIVENEAIGGGTWMVKDMPTRVQ